MILVANFWRLWHKQSTKYKSDSPRASKDINTGPIFLNALLDGVWRYWIRFKCFNLELFWLKGIEEFPLSIKYVIKKPGSAKVLAALNSGLKLMFCNCPILRADLRPYFCLYLLLLFSSQKGTPKNVREGAFGMFHVTLILFQKKKKRLYFPLP